jgi:oxygen-independent coproporphyrinogen-3 oxidase
MNKRELFKKYDVPAPRYTSYPTVPYWTDNPTSEQWIQELKNSFQVEDMTWSMYLHIPFCESLCTFCGCNTSITKDHKREVPYKNIILKEFRTYLEKVPAMRERTLKQMHFGGGTPTFLSASVLGDLISQMFLYIKKDPHQFEGSIEVDPRRTNEEQLKVLFNLGFNRVSMGVQDFDSEVQRLVNRIQPQEQTQKITNIARNLGYTSVNYDLIYGLPKQTNETMRVTTELTVQMRPDRIALYSFALVPWIKPAQRLFKDEDLPTGDAKRELYEISRDILLNAGYLEIGMDHFALPNDPLAIADKNKTLHRNFMGYTEERTNVLLGLGVSAISETPSCFHQNEKALPIYERQVEAGLVPTFRGHLLSEMDKTRREQILKFMTRWQIELESDEQTQDVRQFLSQLEADGLIEFRGRNLHLTESGRPFLRNACMALDQRLRSQAPQTKVFSQSV